VKKPDAGQGATTKTAQQPKRADFYGDLAQNIETMRQSVLERIETEPDAALVAHTLLRAQSAALFAGRGSDSPMRK
jgi:hypothetical protein